MAEYVRDFTCQECGTECTVISATKRLHERDFGKNLCMKCFFDERDRELEVVRSEALKWLAADIQSA